MIQQTDIPIWLGLAVIALAMFVAASATVYFTRRELFDKTLEFIVGIVAGLAGFVIAGALFFRRGRGEGAGGEPNSDENEASAADFVNVERVTTKDTRNEVEELTDELSDERRDDASVSLRERVRRWRERTRREAGDE